MVECRASSRLIAATAGCGTAITTARLAGKPVPSWPDEEVSFADVHQRLRKTIDYLSTFMLPNFFFHVTTAYNILRHNGIAIGKRDFLGG